jgi:hypothetical protein
MGLGDKIYLDHLYINDGKGISKSMKVLLSIAFSPMGWIKIYLKKGIHTYNFLGNPTLRLVH